MFSTKREQRFYDYGKDIEFVRHHKRTTKNFKNAIQDLIDSTKQTMTKGISDDFSLSINFLNLNKSCTVAHIFWDLNLMPPESVGEELRRLQEL